MTATDFLDRRAERSDQGPPRGGWRGFVRLASDGMISPRMGPAAREHQADRTAIQRDFDGPRAAFHACDQCQGG
jgi:hypothetical protein